MVGGECPNCRQHVNTTRSRLVRDACGHSKCRICLLYEEEGCKLCQSEHRIQMIGSFDYPIPSAGFVEVNPTDLPSGKDEVTALQPLELVTVKSQDQVNIIFKQEESSRNQTPNIHVEWNEEQHVDATKNIQILTNNQSSVCFISNQNESTSITRDRGKTRRPKSIHIESVVSLQKHVRGMSESMSVKPADIPKIEPHEVILNIRSHLEESCSTHESLGKETGITNSWEPKESKKVEFSHCDAKTKEKTESLKNSQTKRSHISVIPGSPEKYRCNICNKVFKSKTAQWYHDACLTGIKRYHCKICDRRFVKQSHYEYHERMHSGYKPFKCTICEKAFPQRNKLNRHLLSHQSEKRYKCAICEKGYSHRDDLRSHLNIHNGLAPYVCQICKKTFREATNLTRHMHTHSNEKPHTCEHCAKSFKDKFLLVRHKRTHGKERPFSCSSCSRVFLSKSELGRHLAVHTDEKPFPCPYCTTVFRRKDNLNRHVRHHHSDDGDAENSNRSTSSNAEGRISKPKITNIAKTKPKNKPKNISAQKSPAKISVVYLSSHEQINSQLDTESSIAPVIRTFNESSNAVPVINGPISIRRPEAKTSSPKKTFTHTEPIPPAEAELINRRIEQKLYPKTFPSLDCPFPHDFRNRVDRQHPVHNIITARNECSNKSATSVNETCPEQLTTYENHTSTTPNSYVLSPSVTLTKIDTATEEKDLACHDLQNLRGMNTLRHTVPKKRAIEELRANTSSMQSADHLVATKSITTGQEATNRVPTITKTGVTCVSQIDIASDETEMPFKGKIAAKHVSDIHWRRRTSEILKPRID